MRLPSPLVCGPHMRTDPRDHWATGVHSPAGAGRVVTGNPFHGGQVSSVRSAASDVGRSESPRVTLLRRRSSKTEPRRACVSPATSPPFTSSLPMPHRDTGWRRPIPSRLSATECDSVPYQMHLCARARLSVWWSGGESPGRPWAGRNTRARAHTSAHPVDPPPREGGVLRVLGPAAPAPRARNVHSAGESGTVVPLPSGAASAPWHPPAPPPRRRRQASHSVVPMTAKVAGRSPPPMWGMHRRARGGWRIPKRYPSVVRSTSRRFAFAEGALIGPNANDPNRPRNASADGSASSGAEQGGAGGAVLKKRKLGVSNTPYNGGWWVTDGGWWVTDGGWWVTDGGWWVTAGGWWVTDDGWWVTDGGWWVTAGGNMGTQKRPKNEAKILASSKV